MKILKTTVRGGQKLDRHESYADGRYTLTLTGLEAADAAAAPEQAGLTEVCAVFPFRFEEGDAVFANGYQSWTYSPERALKEADNSLRFCPGPVDKKFGFSQYGEGAFLSPLSAKARRRGRKRGWTYAYVRRGGTYYLFASLAEQTGFTRIELDPGRGTVSFYKDCLGRELAVGEEYAALDLIFIKGAENYVFDAWFAAMETAPRFAGQKTGYTSWYNCYQNISEAQILKDLAGMEALPDHPDIFQIDDGFERFVGDWLDVDEEKFPRGLAPVAEQIRAAGYQAGIWLAPFVCERDSALAEAHPDWLQYRNGKPVYTGSNWSGGLALDPYHPEVQTYLRRCIEHYKAMGFTLFKLDFLYAACMTAYEDRTRGEVMADAMDFLREACGDAQILACGVPLASAFGKAEYCRIGPDMSLSYDDVPYMRLFHAERPSTMHTQRNTLYRRQLNGRAFLSDPDVFLLRTDNTSLSAAQKETLAVVNALFGSVLFTSDDAGSYDEEQRALYTELLRLRRAENVQVQVLETGKHHRVLVSFDLDGYREERELVL